MSCSRLWEKVTNILVSGKLRLGKNASIVVTNADNSESKINLLELAALDNIGASDLAKIDGITNGTGAAGKALVLDSSGNVAMPDNGAIAFSRASVAAAGTDATNATVLADQVNAVTASDGAKGVALPAAATTTGPILVINTVLTSGANLLVYPVNGGNDAINGGAEDAAFTMGPGKAAWFIPTSATQWYVEDAAGVLTTTAEANILDGVTATASEINTLAGVTAGTSAASKALVLDAAESLNWATTDATASETCTLTVTDTRTGAGATGWAAKFDLETNVALGSYANGVYGYLGIGSSGKVTGLGAGVCGETVLSAGCTDGTYACIEAEMGMPSGAVTGTDASFLHLSLYGADAATFDTSGLFFNLVGVTKNSGKLLQDVTSGSTARPVQVLKVKTPDGIRYLPLYSTAACGA